MEESQWAAGAMNFVHSNQWLFEPLTSMAASGPIVEANRTPPARVPNVNNDPLHPSAGGPGMQQTRL
jgi:hypothetical protein